MVRALARVNLAAIERNARRIAGGLSPGTALCAVVKADGYGHGALPSARAALDGGAAMLAVATAEEAGALRGAGIGAPILVMGALSGSELATAVRARTEIVAWDERFLAEAAAEQARHGGTHALRVHVKLDSGMGRLGTRSEAAARAVAETTADAKGLRLTGVMTHFATADDDPEFLARQLAAFEPFAATLRRRYPRLVRHAANSAATLRAPESHLDLVRCGIAIYGADPFHRDPAPHGLEPALELISYVAAVKLARPGESAGYGRTFVAERDTWLATVPIGYGDGFRRGLSDRAEVLIRGVRRPLAGTVSMDNVTVAVGCQTTTRVGDRVVLIGADGPERVSAEELATVLGTINYEVLCGISPRVPREYHRDGEVLR